MSGARPLWLAAPSRFAALRPRRARWVAAGFALVLLLGLAALFVPEPPAVAVTSGHEQEQTDLALYQRIVAAMRGGEGYYRASADALRAGGYPMRPFVTFRLPGLATLQASLPETSVIVLLYVLGSAVALAWGQRLAEALPRPLPRLGAAILLLGSILAFLQPGLLAFHEIWAALLIALSMALRRRDEWVSSVALALIAMLIRETAALYAVVMLLLSWREGARREALGWGVALAVLAGVLAAHAWAVAGVTGPLDPVSPGWAGFEGPGLFVRAITLSTALQLLPLWLGAILVCLAAFGWVAWDDPLGLRMATTLGAYALLLASAARLDTFYWGLLVSPVVLVGLAFAPDGLRDLWRQLLDRRVVRVQRVTR